MAKPGRILNKKFALLSGYITFPVSMADNSHELLTIRESYLSYCLGLHYIGMIIDSLPICVNSINKPHSLTNNISLEGSTGVTSLA